MFRSSISTNNAETATEERPSRQSVTTDQNIASGSNDIEFETMPIIDLDLYLSASTDSMPSEAALAECKKVSECFHNFGIILIRDPRVNMQDNDDYIDLMEEYFASAGDKFYAGEKVEEIKPEFHYQVGATPENIEMARCHREMLANLALSEADTPGSPIEPVLDAKWRYMWKVGERPQGASDDFP